MTNLRYNIHLHNIKVTPVSSSGASLPEDLRLVAKVLVGDDTTATSEVTPLDPKGSSWTLKVKSGVPSEKAFSIEISGQSPTQLASFRFGSISIDPATIVASVDSNQRFALNKPLDNPNTEFPSLQIRAGFTIESTTAVQASAASNLHFPLDERSILTFLHAAQQEAVTINPSDLNIVYKSIQYLPNTNRQRSFMLNVIGDAYMKRYHTTQSMDDLEEAVKIYSEAEQDATWNDPRLNTYLADHGTSLHLRFKCLGDINDIHQSVLKLQEAVRRTPDDNLAKLAMLNNLGNSILTRFEHLGDGVDLNNSIDNFQNAMCLTPDSHPNKPARLNNLGNLLLSHFELLGDVTDLNNSILNYQNAVRLIPNGHPDKPALLNNLGSSLLRRFRVLGDLADLNDSILNKQNAVQLTPEGHPDKPSRFNNLGSSLLRRFERLGDLIDLNRSILNFQNAVRLTPDGHPDKPALLNNLGSSLFMHFERLGDVVNLNNSILNFQNALQLTPGGHPGKPSWFSNLGSSLLSRFQRLGDAADLNNSIFNFQNAVQLTLDDHPDKPTLLNNFGNALLSRFEQLGELADLNNSILNKQNAVQLTPDGHPDMPSRFSNLGGSLFSRFERLGDVADLNNSILNFQNALQLTQDDHPEKPSQFNNLGNSLLRRFQRLGDLTNLNNSILNFQNAVQLIPDDHPDKPALFNNLGSSLLICFERLGDLTDLNNSILNKQNAVQLTPNGHHDMPSRFSNLGNSLFRRFERLGDVIDINESILNYQNAVQLTQDGHPDKPAWFNNLGNSLLMCFERLGDLADLNSSILNFQNAVRLTPDGHPDKPTWLNNLGTSLIKRFEQLGDLPDLNNSIPNLQSAVQLTPNGHPDKPARFNNLGNALVGRYERLGDLGDLSNSILNFQNAAQLIPDDRPDKPSLFNNLGSSLVRRFERLGDLADLNNSILNFQNAVQLIPDAHPDKPAVFHNLGSSLFSRFEKLGDLTDINNSILNKQNAVQLTPDGQSRKPSSLTNLGNSFLARFVHLHNLDDAQQALSSFSLAACASSGSASSRFTASRRSIICHHILKSPPLAILGAYRVAINLLPQLAWLGSSVPERHHQLITASDTVCEAAAVAAQSGHKELAVEWLEQGRSVIWGQLLQLRTPLDFLKSKHTKLGQRLEHTSLQLEGLESQPSITGQAVKLSGIPASSPQEELAKDSHNLAYEREQLLMEIRKQPEFETFMLPKPLSQLTPAAHSGPIIMLTLSNFDNRCNALILLPNLEDDVISLTLESFTAELAKQLYTALRRIISPNEIRNTLENQSSQAGGTSLTKNSEREFEDILERLARNKHNNSLNDDVKRLGIELVPVGKTPVAEHSTFQEILAELWNHVTKPVLNVLAITYSTSRAKPHLWWCPTGILSFLPFHAAGLYGPHAPTGSKLSEFVISSYTPTLTTLLSASEDSTPPASQPQLLIVAETSSDGQRPLPGTRTERLFIEEQTRNCIKLNSLSGAEATVERVVEGLKNASWVHFACHGVQHPSQPTKSALLLAGHSRLTLKDVMQLNLSHRKLAFLSACQTATGDEKVPDEAVHLAAGMLAAGYCGVIATMWSVGDQVAPQVARDVYGQLFTGKGTPDPTEAAHALHHAINMLCGGSGRVHNEWFLSWVPFIHMGI